MHRYVLHNGEINEVTEKTLSPGQVGLLAGWGVFSTIQVCDGVLFAFERHWARMQRDAVVMRVPFPQDADLFRKNLMDLVRANGVKDATLRVVVIRNLGGIWQGPEPRDYDIVALTTGPKDWGPSARLALVPQARHAASRFAGTKILSWAFNLAMIEEAQSRGYDEALLLNERGEVCECTSANIFIAEGNHVWTPPLRSGCLPGVTREILLSEIRVPGIELGEKDLYPSDLERAGEVFITSTTRHLLPVSGIEGLRVRYPGTACAALARAFSEYMESYLDAHGRMASAVEKS